ncbi:MAG: putative 2OG-Fe(II) oxygenase [Sphingomonas sp.]
MTAWIETSPASGVRAPQKAAALRSAIQIRPSDPALHTALGGTLFELRRFNEAIVAYEAALALDPTGFTDWQTLAASQLRAHRPGDALALCDRRWPGAGTPRWHQARGAALAKLGRAAEARAEHLRAMALGDPGLHSLHALLQSIASEGDGAALLEICEGEGAPYADTAAIRAWRAAALSMTGREDEARMLIDLDRSTVRVPFDPPPEFGGIEAFNRLLAAAILDDPPPAPRNEDPDMTYSVRARASAPLAALRDFIRASVADYVGNLDALGLARVMPPPPEYARLTCGAAVLRRGARNKQHVHTTGYVSTVYHVEAPPLEGRRGALALGVCDELTGGHRGCWGERYLEPRAGWLTIIPSHVFHDVVPTGSDAPRIAIVSDLIPMRSAEPPEADAFAED